MRFNFRSIPSEGLVWSTAGGDRGVRWFPLTAAQFSPNPSLPPPSQLHGTFPICQNSNFQQISNFPGRKKENSWAIWAGKKIGSCWEVIFNAVGPMCSPATHWYQLVGQISEKQRYIVQSFLGFHIFHKSDKNALRKDFLRYSGCILGSRQIGPRGPTVCPEKVANWAPDSGAPEIYHPKNK